METTDSGQNGNQNAGENSWNHRVRKEIHPENGKRIDETKDCNGIANFGSPSSSIEVPHDI